MNSTANISKNNTNILYLLNKLLLSFLFVFQSFIYIFYCHKFLQAVKYSSIVFVTRVVVVAAVVQSHQLIICNLC